MTITLPIPHSDLWPNSRKHWRVKSKKTKEARHSAWVRTKGSFAEDESATIGRSNFTGYTLSFFYPDARRRDDDNAQASCKAYRDGIADALGVDDNTLRLAALPTFAIDRENPRVEITLIP